MPTEFVMPQLGESVVEGTVARWLKQEGDTVETYEPLLEVETDKVTSEVPAPVGGVILQIMVPQGETVPTGALLCLIGEPDEAAAEEGPAQPEAADPDAPSRKESPSNVVSQRRTGRNGPPITPVVARIAAEHNIDVSQVPGTGRGGRVSKKDILAYIEAQEVPAEAEAPPEPGPSREVTPRKAPAPAVGPASPQPPSPPQPGPLPGQTRPLDGMRQAIAEHMIRSRRTSAHVTTLMEADCSRIRAYRARHQADFLRQEGIKLTYTPFFMAATATALKETPIVNSRLTEAGLHRIDPINIGLAVALDEGLIVPVVKNADRYNLTGLQRAVTDLAGRARRGQLKPDEVQDGTFTLTNHGTSGSLLATPIINQPQVGILGIGAIEKRVVVVTQDGVDSIAIKPMCYLSFSFDHRVLDGARADQFLAVVKREIENWRVMPDVPP